MKKAEQEKILKSIELMYEQLESAYDLAGGIRDTFSHVEQHQGILKEYCNDVRRKIYELREVKGMFNALVKTL